MHGIHISTPDDEHANGISSDFERLFGFLIPGLPDYHWLINGGLYDPFRWPLDWFGDDAGMARSGLRFEETSHGVLVDTASLASCMRWLTDFNITIYGFTSREVDLSRWKVHRMTVAGRERVFEGPASAELIFRNEDGLFWEFFSNRVELVRLVADCWPKGLIIEPALRNGTV